MLLMNYDNDMVDFKAENEPISNINFVDFSEN